jgi:hypothetical protein
MAKRIKLSDRILPDYTMGEERMNMVTHIVGGAIWHRVKGPVDAFDFSHFCGAGKFAAVSIHFTVCHIVFLAFYENCGIIRID